MKPYLFSSHMISYVETFQGVYKVKPKYQNDEVSKEASQSTNTNINITLYSSNKHTEIKLKIQELGGGGSLVKVLTVHVKT